MLLYSFILIAMQVPSFAFYGEDECIMHRDEKVTHPRGRLPNPSNGTECVVLSDVRDCAEFYFGNLDGKEISPNHVQLQSSDRCTIL